jgi:hypothetical protein
MSTLSSSQSFCAISAQTVVSEDGVVYDEFDGQLDAVDFDSAEGMLT